MLSESRKYMKLIKKSAFIFLMLLAFLSLNACGQVNNSIVANDDIEITRESADAAKVTEYVADDSGIDISSSDGVSDKDKSSADSKKKKDKASKKSKNAKADNKTEVADNKTTKEEPKKKSVKKSDNTKAKTSDKVKETKETYTCSLRIECKEILDGNLEKLSLPKRALVPKDGMIYDNQSITFEKGDTVWSVLSSCVKANSIQMEYTYVPVYKTNYIKGIAGLYEFDCGDTSGWRYMVNGNYPSYGCDKYKLKNNDKIVWHYTVKLD